MDHSKTGHFRPFEYRTVWVSGIQMNPVFGCPVIDKLSLDAILKKKTGLRFTQR